MQRRLAFRRFSDRFASSARPSASVGGRARGVSAEDRRKILSDLRVTDGGGYDNLGLEPVWKDHRVVLVSDSGGLMDGEADQNLLWRIQRYQAIQDRQARGVRKRFLICGYAQGTIAEEELQRRLAGSSRRKLLGRG